MTDKPPVPLKTKIAAWMLIGLGIAFTVYIAFSYIDLGVHFGPVSEAAKTMVSALFWQALFIGLLSFIAGLLMFDQKRRLLLFALVIFLISFTLLLVTWRMSAGPLATMFQSAGCDFNSCANNETAAESESNSFNLVFALTALPLIAILADFSLVYAGTRLLRRDKRAWFFIVTLLPLFLVAFFLMGIFSGTFDLIFEVLTLSVIIFLGLAVIVLLAIVKLVKNKRFMWLALLALLAFSLVGLAFMGMYIVADYLSDLIFIIPIAIITLLLLDRKKFFELEE